MDILEEDSYISMLLSINLEVIFIHSPFCLVVKVNGKEQELYAILFKGQNGSAQSSITGSCATPTSRLSFMPFLRCREIETEQYVTPLYPRNIVLTKHAIIAKEEL